MMQRMGQGSWLEENIQRFKTGLQMLGVFGGSNDAGNNRKNTRNLFMQSENTLVG